MWDLHRRTSSLSVPYGLEGSGIILFLGKNALAHAHTPAERKQDHFLVPPASSNPAPPFAQSDSQVLTCAHKDTHLLLTFTHKLQKKKSFSWSFDVFFMTHVVSYDKISLQLAKIMASPEWCFEFCCHFNKLIVWLTCSTISMHAMHLTLIQWISIFIHSLCRFTIFKCMWKRHAFECVRSDSKINLCGPDKLSNCTVRVCACMHIPVQYLYSLQSTIMLVMCPTE